jgi:Tol biopolymer transport system component
MSFRSIAILAFAAIVLTAAGCSSGRPGSADSTSAPAFTVPGVAASVPTTVVESGSVPQTIQPGDAAVSTTGSSVPIATTLDPQAWRAQPIALVSRAVGGGQADGHSWRATISGDGRFVAFDSQADNLVPGDTNLVTVPGPSPEEPSYTYNAADVFVFDRQTGLTERVSVATDGTQGNRESEVSFISTDGRWVVFQSEADNLVADDTNGMTDVFVHDRQTGVTELVSLGIDGAQGNGKSLPRGISAGGRYVLFNSSADNLVPGDTNGARDLFVRDRANGSVERVSVGYDGEQADKDSWGGAMSADGRFVVFQSSASNLVPGDTNGADDIFVHDREKGTTERVSVSKAGKGGNHSSYEGSISADGRYVAFMSSATNLVPGDTSSLRNDVFLYDRKQKTIQRVSISPTGREGNNTSGSPSISADGRYVAFLSHASNLVSGDTNRMADVFVRDLKTGVTRRVSLNAKGEQADKESLMLDLSGDGRWVAFMSMATNLVPHDTNESDDIFVVKAER